MLYLIKSGNYLKVGYTKDKTTYYNRMQSYQTNNPDIEILEVVEDGTLKDEKYLHELLKEYKHRNEWFLCNKNVYDIWNNYTRNMKRFDPNDYSNIIDGTKTTRSFSEFVYTDQNLIKLVQSEFGEEGCLTGIEIKQKFKNILSNYYNKKINYVIIDYLSNFGYSYIQKKVNLKKVYFYKKTKF